jgi:hypothetical protein
VSVPLSITLLLLLLLQVAAAKGKLLSYALDTKGPEIRTAMLKGGEDILLSKGAAAGPLLSCSRAGEVRQGKCGSKAGRARGHGLPQNH